MEKFQANFPMALDEASHRLFVGCRKPGRAFFEALLSRAGCQAGEVVMVGDDAANDIEGARQAIAQRRTTPVKPRPRTRQAGRLP